MGAPGRGGEWGGPAGIANAASLRSRCGLSPAVTSSCRRPRGRRRQRAQGGVDRGDQRGDQRVELGDLGRHCWWRRARARSAITVAVAVGRRGPVGAAGGAVRHQLAVTQLAQLSAQRVGRGDDQRLDLGLRLGAGRHRAAPGHPQRAQGSTSPPRPWGHRRPGRPARPGPRPRRRPGRTCPAGGGSCGPAVDLDQLDPRGLQERAKPAP